MQKHVGWLWIVGFFGLLAAADAQTSSPPTANTQFDGTYAFVSATKVSETFRDFNNREHPCGELKGGLLTIVNGNARYTGESLGYYEGSYYEGTVNSQGELAIHLATSGGAAGIAFPVGISRIIYGRIDGNGTLRAPRITGSCNYDLIWQKVQSISFPIPSAQFDGTYAIVSSTKANETYVNRGTGQVDNCPERRSGTLTIINGQAHLPNFAGTVGSRGELAMLCVRPDAGVVKGTIEKNGTIQARRTIGDCSYDTIWRKESE